MGATPLVGTLVGRRLMYASDGCVGDVRVDRFRGLIKRARACVCVWMWMQMQRKMHARSDDATTSVLNEMCASSNNKPINSFLCLLACEFNRPALIRHKKR